MSDSQSTVTNVDFNSLILGLASSALFYMGEGQVEGKELKEPNLPLAKQNIDIIEMLSEKTRGNLNDEEKTLVSEVLLDLRAKYLNCIKS